MVFRILAQQATRCDSFGQDPWPGQRRPAYDGRSSVAAGRGESVRPFRLPEGSGK